MADRDGGAHEGRNLAEWVTLAVSIAIVAGFVGAALHEEFFHREPPGAIIRVALEIDQAERRGDRFYVPFDVANDGGAPAEDVTLVFEVRQGEQVVEESTAVIPFLPSDGEEAGEVVLTFDPARLEVTARVGNFLVP